jgi:TIR domain
MTELTMFISHRTEDSELAAALIQLFEKTLKLPARQIRCTSVDGYRLSVGTDTDDQLRREVFEARVFIALITPSSLKSTYVVFELGARWGAKRYLAPLLGRGATAANLGGPLSGINALQLHQRPQVLQLVEDIADHLQLPLEPAASYQVALDAVIAAASVLDIQELPRATPKDTGVAQELDGMESKILEILSNGEETAERVAARTKLKLQKAEYHLSRLSSAGMVFGLPSGGAYKYFISQRGREFLVKAGLL